MMRLFLSLVFILMIFRSPAQERHTSAAHENGSTLPRNLQPDTRSDTLIDESILNNMAIHKQEIAANVVRATGSYSGKQKHFVIHYRGNQLHGAWESFFDNGLHCDSGSFKYNLPDGEWRTWYPNGQLKTIREYSSEKYRYIRADVKLNHPKFPKYPLTILARTGSVETYFQPAYETVTLSKGISILQKIQHNTENTGKYIAPFNNCLHHGLFVNYFENGVVKDSGQYVNGLKDGLWRETDEAGLIRVVGPYRNGIKNGQWKYYDRECELIFSEWYKNGKSSDAHYFRH